LVCLSTITALAKIGNVRAVELLITALCDNREFIRTYAARTLQEIGTPEALAAVEAWRREQNEK
jgi:HEAT repeat protein